MAKEAKSNYANLPVLHMMPTFLEYLNVQGPTQHKIFNLEGCAFSRRLVPLSSSFVQLIHTSF